MNRATTRSRILALLILGSAAALAAAAEPEHQLLFGTGKEGYFRFRIPSLIVTPGGSLLAMCEGRKNVGALTGDINLVMRRSSDGGKTWSDLAIALDDGEHTLGNPCLVIDRDTNIIWLGLTRSKGNDTEEEIVAGTSDEATRVLVSHSKDDGLTWAKPTDITATAKQPDWTWYGTGPGVGIQLKNGRLIIPSYHAQAKTGVYRSHMVYSDDHGKTWKRGEPIGDHTSECHVVERRDGELYLSTRTVEGREQRTIARSKDGGVTWPKTEFDESLYDPHCQACVIALKPGDDDKPAWLFTHPAGPDRRKLTARLSTDEGKTWPESVLLREGDSQYTCLAQLADGSIALLYDCWENKNYRVYFTTFDVASLKP